MNTFHVSYCTPKCALHRLSIAGIRTLFRRRSTSPCTLRDTCFFPGCALSGSTRGSGLDGEGFDGKGTDDSGSLLCPLHFRRVLSIKTRQSPGAVHSNSTRNSASWMLISCIPLKSAQDIAQDSATPISLGVSQFPAITELSPVCTAPLSPSCMAHSNPSAHTGSNPPFFTEFGAKEIMGVTTGHDITVDVNSVVWAPCFTLITKSCKFRYNSTICITRSQFRTKK